MKKHLSLILALLLCLCLCPVARAETSTNGDYEYILLEDGTAQITRFTGKTSKLSIPSSFNGVPVTSIGDYAFAGWYNDTLTNITIPKGVTTIGKEAFRGCVKLTSVTIPSSVTTIGDGAFSQCTKLTSVTIPSSVTTIGKEAFSWCVKLTRITISNGVTTIGDYAFYNCKLTDVTIPDSVTTIGKNPFRGNSMRSIKVSRNNPVFAAVDNVLFDKVTNTLICYPKGKSGKSYAIPQGTVRIGDSAFDWCMSLTSVTIPDSVTTIGDHAFCLCTGLFSVAIPDSVVDLGINPFERCENLGWSTSPEYPAFSVSPDHPALAVMEGALVDKVTHTLICYPMGKASYENSYAIPQGVEVIGDDAFSGCTALASVTIPESVTTIGNDAFSGCTALASVTIPEGVTTIGNEAFSGCTALASVTILEGVRIIGVDAFLGCSRLTSITIPDSVEDMGYDMFAGCPDLIVTVGWKSYAARYCQEKGIPYRDGEPQIVISGDYEYILLEDGTAEVTGYRGKDTYLRIPGTLDDVPVTRIGNEAFSGHFHLTRVILPDSVTTIGDGAFCGCGLTSITIPDSVTAIGSNPFRQCGDLRSIKVSPDHPAFTVIDNVLIEKATNTLICYPKGKTEKSYVIPQGIQEIGDYAFDYCTNLTSVVIPDSVTTVGVLAFTDCYNLTSVIIPNSVTSFYGAFYACYDLTATVERDSYAEKYCRDEDIPYIYADSND